MCWSFSFKDKSKEVVKTVSVTYHNPVKNKVITKKLTVAEVQQQMIDQFNLAAVTSGLLPLPGAIVTGSAVEFHEADDENAHASVDDEQQAEEVAKSKTIKSYHQRRGMYGILQRQCSDYDRQPG
jgi:hypothetical protein